MLGSRSICYLLFIIAIAEGKPKDDAYYTDNVRNGSSFIINFNNNGSNSFSCDQQLEMCKDNASREEIRFSLHKKLEASLTSNPLLLHQLRQVFFPTTGTHIQEVGMALLNVSISAICSDEQKCCFSQLDEKDTYNIPFIWTASPLMSMVTVDQFLIMDSLITPRIYERIVTSMVDYHQLILFDISDLQCPPQDEEIVQALIHLLSWVKAYARYDGKPNTFEERDKGYIAKYYNYYTSENLYKKGRHNHARKIRLVLLAIIACLNIVLPAGFALGGAKQLQIMLLPDSKNTGNNGLKKAVAVTIVFTNVLYIILYFISTAIQSDSHGSLLECIRTSKKHCIMSPQSTLYWDEAITMASVWTLVPLAAGFELIIAIVVQVHTRNKRIKANSVTTSCCRVLILWNAMIFMQIWVGLILIPTVIFLVIAPVDTISFLGCFALGQVHISLTIKYLFFDGKCYRNCKCCLLFSVKLLVCIVLLVLLIILGVLYSELLEVGASVQPLKRFALSLVPSFILTMLAWVIRKRFLKSKQLNESNATTEFRLKSIHVHGEEYQCLLSESEDESDVV